MAVGAMRLAHTELVGIGIIKMLVVGMMGHAKNLFGVLVSIGRNRRKNMSTKALLPNQCMPLHIIYGEDDCCLCRAHRRIRELELKTEKPKVEPKRKRTKANP